ncbi:MAG: hypothetical protein IIX47_05120, partial [Spirochaetaceae bacterium]|nr:hypothetical protein [Spirochaetaceae bacterium]
AGNAVQKFSDTSVIKIEIRQFESKLKAQKALLGDVVENALENNQTQLDLNTEEITAIANEIARIKTEINNRQELLKKSSKEASSETPAE